MIFFFLLFLPGCGLTSASQKSPLQVSMHLPSALGRTETRRQRFVQRVNRLEVEVRSREGLQKVLNFAPGNWDRIALGDLSFPASATDALTVRVKIWDSQRDGSPRQVPALVGKATLKAEEMAEKGPTQLHVRLSLRVSVNDY